jgi:hypothetical protein
LLTLIDILSVLTSWPTLPTLGPDESSPPESSFDSEELGLDDELLGSSLGDEDSDDSGDSELLGLSSLGAASLEELDEELELVPLEPSTCVQALMPRAIVPAIAATLSLRVINLVMRSSPCSE